MQHAYRLIEALSRDLTGSSKRTMGFLIVSLVLLAGRLPGEDEATRRELIATYERDVHPILETYCIRCHGGDEKKGGVDFARFKAGVNPLSARSLWRSALHEVINGEMPPENKPQLDDKARYLLKAWLNSVKQSQNPDPGQAPIRRLSRLEYGNTVRELFGIDTPIEVGLPEDHPGEGFDNSVSPLLLEKYLIAADGMLDEFISADQMDRELFAGHLEAVINGKMESGNPDQEERRFDQAAEVWVLLNVPIEGSYTIKIEAGADQAGKEPTRLGVQFDGSIVDEIKVTAKAASPRTYTTRVKLLAGTTRFSVLFMNPLSVSDAKNADETRAAVIRAITITGPRAKPWTAVQRRLFTAIPSKTLSPRDAAQQIITPFAFRAFRRQPYAHEITMLMNVYDLAESQGQGFSDALRLVFKAILISPQFLFRTPMHAPDEPGSGKVIAVDGFELASRLSYLFWSTMPDEELFTLARSGQLNKPDMVARQVKRLLADPRASAFVDTFALRWLGIDGLPQRPIDEKLFPQMTVAMRQAMLDECRALFAGLMREGGSILDLLDCDYTYVNAQNAKLYGLEAKGQNMEKVQLRDRNRGGLIAMPAILASTSLPNRTSPAKRGYWVLDTLFDSAPPPPPPETKPLSSVEIAGTERLTLRQKMDLHRTDEACVGCHRVMDPLGFGLENFDSIGRWRTSDDGGGMIDAIGVLPGEQRFSSPEELKRLLLGRKKEFTRNFAARLLSFTMSRTLTAYDEIVVDELTEQAVANDYRFDAMLVALATSYPFLHRHSLP